MASQEHKDLAFFIKEVHHSLRQQYRKLGHEEAWKNHCSQRDLLEKYASTMHLLATKYWENLEVSSENVSKNRIQWVVTTCMKYFFNGGKETELMKELNKREKLNGKDVENWKEVYQLTEKTNMKIRLLDVGSCYNPFKQFSLFDVVSIDIAPATSDVCKCDFLSVNVLDCGPCYESLQQLIARNEIPSNFFDVIVFSLFLEYVPCPRERYKCCQKAYNLLKPEGLLFIITPDSKHATANAQLMKRWRAVLGKLGFHRIYYEKLQHLHCMAYRKSIDQSIPQKWASNIIMKLAASFSDEDNSLYIPQDNNSCTEEVDGSDIEVCQRNQKDNAVLVEMFTELPSDYE